MNASTQVASRFFSDVIISELYLCTEENEVEDFFQKFSSLFQSSEMKVKAIKECMGVEAEYRAPITLTPEQEYQDWINIFLDGSWRI